MDCELKDITVHYEMLGAGRPIIMLHGWSIDHRHMMSDLEPVFEHRDGWKRIYLDLPGHGRTPGKDWITNQDKMLDVVLDFIDNIISGQKFVVVGASAGAYLARGIVHHRMATLDGLLLMVPLIVADDAIRCVPPHVTLVADAALAVQLEPEEAEGLFQGAVVQSRKVVDYIRANFQSASEIGDLDFQAKIREYPKNYAFSFEIDALPQPFPAPTLIVTGRQDSWVGYHDAWEILDNYPRGTFAVLDRAGHFLGVEQEDLFHALVCEWLDRVEEYAGVSSRV
ncbi:MAG: 2-hydroxy-6-oxo-6-phenylhexa-2,4-dienoate hydrolase [Anaerolineales bacterium]|nr:alpha/beta hydrolase [Anaerolineae bacterium]PWB53376.1 MAG: 2-hydroxy-6-oxo-6-phenylhexa-2,4-dienoate hydrolase [Anaerolineales bacterium]